MLTIERDTAQAIVNALRSGTVPPKGLEHLAVGIDPIRNALRVDLEWVAKGNGAYKFIRGSYGSGKTFATSLVAADALAEGFVTSKVVISVNDTPLYKLSEVYRRICQGLATPNTPGGALNSIFQKWLGNVEAQVIELDGISETSPDFSAAVGRRLETNLSVLGQSSGRLASCLQAFHAAQVAGNYTERQGILDWMSGEPKVNQSIKRAAGVTGQLDNTDALTFLRGILEVLRQACFKGLLVVIDEAEVILRMRKPERTKSLEELRKLVDAINNNEFPGLLIMVTGTPDFFDSGQGVPQLQPLHQRIGVEFREDRPDNLRQAQIRLKPFDRERLRKVAHKVRGIYPWSSGSANRVSDAFIERMIDEVTRGFGGSIDLTPRHFLRELVNVLDLVDQDPSYLLDLWHYLPQSGPGALERTPEEEAALEAGRRSIDL